MSFSHLSCWLVFSWLLLVVRPGSCDPGALKFSQDSRQLAADGPDGLEVWELRSGRRTALLPKAGPKRVTFNLRGTLLALGQPGNRLTLWDPKAKTVRVTRTSGPNDPTAYLEVYATEESFVTAGAYCGRRDDAIRWWHPDSLKLIRSKPGAGVKLSSDSRLMWIQESEAGALDGGGSLVRANTGETLKVFAKLTARWAPENTLIFLSDHKSLHDEPDRCWWLDTRSMTRNEIPSINPGMVDGVGPGRSIVTLESDSTFKIHRPHRPPLKLRHLKQGVLSFVGFSPNGEWLVTREMETDKYSTTSTHIWDARSGKLCKTLPFSASTLSLDGRYLACNGYDGLRVVDLSDFSVRVLRPAGPWWK